MFSLVVASLPLLRLPGVLGSFFRVAAVIAVLLLLLCPVVMFCCSAQQTSCCGTVDFVRSSGSTVGCTEFGTY